MKKLQYLLLLPLAPLTIVYAGAVEVVSTEFTRHGTTWSVSTTLRHADSGWDHYADAWRVVDKNGKVFGKRVLYHPHENEQPFTRSQRGIQIPSGVNIVFVEAHDKVHGWSKQRVRVDLGRASGKRFRVSR